MSNDNDLAKMETKRTCLPNIRKRQLELLGHIVRNEDIDYLILAGQVEGNSD